MTCRHLPYEIHPELNRYHFYETRWKQVALDLLLRHLPTAQQTVLDYGCGRGETLELFGAAGFKVTGTDLDPECVRLSSLRGTACLLDASNPLGQFGRKSFDIVTCFHVLEHVENPKKTLTALAQIARSHVLLAVPNLRYLNLLFTRRIDLSMVNEGHLQSWDHWHLLNLAERHCGLKLVGWGFDATILPVVSNLAEKLLGKRAVINLETGLFRRMFPYHGISVLGLFKVAA
jgi:SAM-dependent methyltransferase